MTNSSESIFVDGPNGLRIEYRFADNKCLDEIVLWHNNQCLFHLEQMDENRWYFGVYLPGTEKNEHGIIPPAHVIQAWCKDLIAANSLGDLKVGGKLST